MEIFQIPRILIYEDKCQLSDYEVEDNKYCYLSRISLPNRSNVVGIFVLPNVSPYVNKMKEVRRKM